MASRHIFLLLFPLILFSAPEDFKSCQLKYQVSSIQVGDTQAFAVDENYALFYSKDTPTQKVIKRDPFLGLNLIRSKQKFKHIFKFYNNAPASLAGVCAKEIVEGKILVPQIGLNQLGSFSKPIESNAIIGGSCCGILGLVTPRGVIEKEYIRHFLRSKEVVYGDLGIRLGQKKGVKVVEVNPFFAGSPFLLDDEIVSMDGKKAVSAAELSRRILFSAPGSEHRFVILRDNHRLKISTRVQKRISGGLVPDSFFDLFGLELDENLFVQENNSQYEIKKGDRLLYVMGKEVKTLADIRQVLSLEKESKNKKVVLLFKREGFDFFIHFSKPNNSK